MSLVKPIIIDISIQGQSGPIYKFGHGFCAMMQHEHEVSNGQRFFTKKHGSLELSPTEQQALHAKGTFWQPGKITILWDERICTYIKVDTATFLLEILTEFTSAIVKYFIHVEQHVEHPLEIQQKHFGTSWSTTHGRRSLPSFLRGFSGFVFCGSEALSPHVSESNVFWKPERNKL